jgi:hypothetical protein
MEQLGATLSSFWKDDDSYSGGGLGYGDDFSLVLIGNL